MPARTKAKTAEIQRQAEIFIDIPALYEAQQFVRDHAKRYNVLAWGRRAGKTTFGSDLVIETCLDKGGKLGWFAPDFKILDPVWNYYVELFAAITVDKDETKRYLELVNGGIFECWSMHSGVVGRSRDYDRAVVDEAGHVDNFKKRWEKEIAATLIDRVGDAWFFSSTNGINDLKYYFDLGKNPNEEDWASFSLPTWENPFLPKKERERVKALADSGDVTARQEYGAEFIDGNASFVPVAWVDACTLNAEFWKPLPQNTPIVVGIDVGAKNDLFSLTGWGRDPVTRKYKPAFVKLFHPEELVGPMGKVDFTRPKEFLKQVGRNYRVLQFPYDPFQAWDLANELWLAGVGIFEEFPQGEQRTLADSMFYTLIRDLSIELYMHDQSHMELAQHIKNADAKIAGEDRRRLVKRTDDQKIDAAVSSSMAIFALSQYGI